jgi:membrane-anchored protein YejM (alkaline phosphatase superfamily)
MTTSAPESAPDAARPDPPDGANNLVVIILDSLRYDSCMAANTPTMEKLGAIEQRWSYASWTAPSHYNLLMGLLPHASPTHVYASEYYKTEFVRYAERLGVPDMEFSKLLPSLWLPSYLRNSLGYRTSGMVSMPVLNRHTPISAGFDDWLLMARHNDMRAMVDRMSFDGDRPWFHLLNIGETHYPYALADEDPSEWPRISGVHGVFKHLDEEVVGGELMTHDDSFFDDDQMERLRQRQIRAAAAVDQILVDVFDAVPKGTWVIVTADHGELFGEGGYFGHGPIAHEKVHEVPFVEGLVR